MNILLFGAPGTGKGTQSAFLVSRMNFFHISTGDLFRSALSQKTTLGLKAQSYMDKGQLVPDQMVIEFNQRDNCLLCQMIKVLYLDGFPRTLVQAEALDDLFLSMNKALDKVLYLNMPMEQLVERLSGRRVAEKSGRVYHVKFKPPKVENVCDESGETLLHRKDDQPEVVQERLNTYVKQTAPLIEYYQKKNILFELEAMGSPEEVFSRIYELVKKV